MPPRSSSKTSHSKRRPVKNGMPAIRSLRGSRRATLGTRTYKTALKATLKKPSINRGEPLRFSQRISPTHQGTKSGWARARTHHFRRVLAVRKLRKTQLGHWRRSRQRVRPH